MDKTKFGIGAEHAATAETMKRMHGLFGNLYHLLIDETHKPENRDIADAILRIWDDVEPVIANVYRQSKGLSVGKNNNVSIITMKTIMLHASMYGMMMMLDEEVAAFNHELDTFMSDRDAAKEPKGYRLLAALTYSALMIDNTTNSNAHIGSIVHTSLDEMLAIIAKELVKQCGREPK